MWVYKLYILYCQRYLQENITLTAILHYSDTTTTTTAARDPNDFVWNFQQNVEAKIC